MSSMRHTRVAWKQPREQEAWEMNLTTAEKEHYVKSLEDVSTRIELSSIVHPPASINDLICL